MSQSTTPRWKKMPNEETHAVEHVLRTKFPRADAYRYNSASIRVRVIDPRFEGKSHEKRDAMVEPLIDKLPKELQSQIINLLTLTPDEANSKQSLANLEFEDPSPSTL
jgi:hypothetical protein